MSHAADSKKKQNFLFTSRNDQIALDYCEDYMRERNLLIPQIIMRILYVYKMCR